MILIIIGRIMFYLGYPFLAFYLSLHDRARVVIRCGDEVLLVKSWLWKDEWDLPGGGLHTGEDARVGANRELREELAIRAEDEDLVVLKKEPYQSGWVRYRAHYLRLSVAVKPRLKLQKREINEARWFSQTELVGIPLHKQHLQVILDTFND